MSKENFTRDKSGRRFNPKANRKATVDHEQPVFGDDMTWEYPSTHLTQVVEVMATERKREALNYAINICLDRKYEISSKIFNSCVTDQLRHATADEKDRFTADFHEALRELEAVTRALEQLFETYDELF